MPWAVSNVILYYDPASSRKAGLDPNKPPQTLERGAGRTPRRSSPRAPRPMASRSTRSPTSSSILLAKSGGAVRQQRQREGRTGHASQPHEPDGHEDLAVVGRDGPFGLALDTGSDPNSIDHLLAVATGNAAMTFEASGVIGSVEQVLASGQYPGVQIATAPLPALTTGGGVPVGDGSLWISASFHAGQACGGMEADPVPRLSRGASLPGRRGRATSPSALQLPACPCSLRNGRRTRTTRSATTSSPAGRSVPPTSARSSVTTRGCGLGARRDGPDVEQSPHPGGGGRGGRA